MDSATGVYQGFISNTADYERVKREYLSRSDIAQEEVTDFPQTAEQQRGLVKIMFEAAQDCSQTYEPSESQSVRRIQSGAYTDVEWELILWPLLMSARSAQEGHCQLPRYLGCKAPQYNAYGSFTERFHAILDSLRLSKALVLSLFKDATFINRLAWRPKSELSLKATNRKLNEDRNAQNAIGLRVANRDGIKADENGTLVDASGRVYGNVKKRSAALEDTLARSKKRSRNSQRDSFASSISMSSQTTRDATASPLNGPLVGSSPAPAQSGISPIHNTLHSTATGAVGVSTFPGSKLLNPLMASGVPLNLAAPDTSTPSTVMSGAPINSVYVQQQFHALGHQQGAGPSLDTPENT
ncbi:hypothetical protein F5Y13DRAFT_189850 [Hypoxylon sp. FL1857]|nr:hypothetical protein F5Y13DRAFT_189850 [Hypoxylon sp. FL1857]